MNTTDVAFVCLSVLAAGVIAGWIARKALREAMWGRYAFQWSVTFRPVPQKTERAAATASPPAREANTSSAQSNSGLALMPGAETMTRQDAARLLGYSERTVRRLGKRRVLDEVPDGHGGATRVTAGSVERLLRARNEAA